ncbi:protein kinase domain-containing protein [Hyalangium gracile]|uniref:protein kinase domain-containing protein n=1 Tax=Hyalangium gracile TaxID=394092 RepID=UPI001CCDC210
MLPRTSSAPHSPAHGALIGPWRVLETAASGSFGTVFRSVLAAEPHRSGDCALIYEWARRHTPNSCQVLNVLAQLALALAELHRHGALHRDVKGDNVLVGAQGNATLLDLGCCTYPGARTLTDSALPPGTSIYRSPEALRWAWAHRRDGATYEARPADDIYALGVTAYRLSTRTYPPQPTENSGPSRRVLPPSDLATVSPGLEQLLMTMLSEVPAERPPAASLAHALSAAAEEPAATKLITPSPAAAPTEKARNPGPPRWREVPGWLSASATVVVGGLLVVAASKLWDGTPGPAVSPESPPLLTEHVRESPSPEAPDAGVGEEALASAVDVPHIGMPVSAIGLAVPRTPRPGQRKPPCDLTSEVAVHGACWAVLAKKPPCDASGYEYDGKCVVPSFTNPRAPASEEPR